MDKDTNDIFEITQEETNLPAVSTSAIPIGKRARAEQQRREFSCNFDLYLQRARMTKAELCRLNNENVKAKGWRELKPYHISRYNTGEQTPKIDHLKQIAELLKVDVSDLVPSFEDPEIQARDRMAMIDMGNGKSLIDFYATVDTRIARKIITLLASEPS